MKAVRFLGPGKPFEVCEVPTPEPADGEVLVQIAASGVCASELHMRSGRLPSRAMEPITPGHEPAGTITAVGRAVSGWQPGDRVAVVFARRACGECVACLQRRTPDECLLPLLMGVDVDGAWAEYLTVPTAALVRLPDSVPFDLGALMTDAVATPFNAVVSVGDLRIGERVAVFGAGGLGMHAVQLARLGGASYIAAVDPRVVARIRAKERGADIVVDPTRESASEVIRETTDGWGVDLALECVGTNDVLLEAIASLAPRGRCVIVGVGPDPVELGPSLLMAAYQLTLKGVLTYRREHYEALLRLVVGGRLDLTQSISHTFALEDVNEAVAVMEENKGDPSRVMLIP